MASKTYINRKHPQLRIGGSIKFVDGEYTTSDAAEQAKIEGSSGFGLTIFLPGAGPASAKGKPGPAPKAPDLSAARNAGKSAAEAGKEEKVAGTGTKVKQGMIGSR